MTACPEGIQADIPKTTFESRASQSTLQISAPAQSQGPRLDDELYPLDLTDEVATGLFLGGAAVDDMLDLPAVLSFTADSHGFDAVVTLSAWVSPLGWGVPEYRYGLTDAQLTSADALAVVDAARWAHQRRGKGQRILIRSQAGLNRAGLVAGLVLILDGAAPGEALAALRRGRSPHALTNLWFLDWFENEAVAVLQRPA